MGCHPNPDVLHCYWYRPLRVMGEELERVKSSAEI